MIVDDIMDGGLLWEMIRSGYVKVQKHPDDPEYQILNYTDKAVFDRVWNEATLQCRGLIVKGPENAHKVVIARPFRKFFNYGEPEAAKFGLDERVLVLDKVDGSLGILYTAPDGRPAIATRGSFASPQALHATELYRRKYEGHWRPNEDYTYLFEIVFPENRIVLDYGQQDDLSLLGAVHMPSGLSDFPELIRDFDNWRGPMAQTLGEKTLGDALAMAPRPNAEGLVVRDFNGARMVKVKQEDYLALHKIVFGLTEKAVWERLVAGDSAKEICDGLPDEFHPWVTEVANRLTKQFVDIYRVAFREYGFIRGTTDVSTREGKKAFATRVQEFTRITGFQHPGLLYALRDGKQITEAIWDLVKPAHKPFTTTNVQEQEAA